jgi:hypothetical protein
MTEIGLVYNVHWKVRIFKISACFVKIWCITYNTYLGAQNSQKILKYIYFAWLYLMFVWYVQKFQDRSHISELEAP